jgi:hypothetical protein
LGPRWEPTRRYGQEALDTLLKEATGVITGYQQTYLDEFERAVEAVEQNDELSAVGKQRALKKVVQQFENHRSAKVIGDAWIERAEREVARLEGVVSKRPARGETQSEQIAHELRQHRALEDFRKLAPEAQRAKVREAIDKAAGAVPARQMLWNLLDDNLLDAAMESRARAALSHGANPEAAKALAELVGVVDYTGKRDPSTGALSVAKYSRDQFHSYLRERTGVDLSLDQLAEQHQVAKPIIDEHAIRLTRQAASNAVVFRQAQAEAQQRGLQLEVEPIREATFNSGSGEDGSGGGGG